MPCVLDGVAKVKIGHQFQFQKLFIYFVFMHKNTACSILWLSISICGKNSKKLDLKHKKQYSVAKSLYFGKIAKFFEKKPCFEEIPLRFWTLEQFLASFLQ